MVLKRDTKLFLFALAVLVFIAGSAWYVAKDLEREAVLTVAFLDVGQGDSIYIESPSGKQMLVDGGPNSRVLRELSRVMPFYDRTLDVVVATHPDRDHIGGLSGVLSRYDVAYVIDTGATSSTNVSRAYEEAKEREEGSGARHEVARRGLLIDFCDGAYARILFPDRDVRDGKDTNTGSIVLQLVYASTTVMLTGDAPKGVEKYLVTLDGETLYSDILKAGHHGSKTSSVQEFVTAVAPTYAIISAGKDNSYGHPHEEALAALQAESATILATFDLGTIIFKSDGTKIVLKTKPP